MKEIKKLTLKYIIIVASLFLLQSSLTIFFPELYRLTIVNETFTQTVNTLWGTYDTLAFNIILASFLLGDLRRIGVKNKAIPLLTILSSFLGIFLTALLLINNKLNDETNL